MADHDEQPVRVTVLVRGRVQGVGFRWWTRQRAVAYGLSGWARNLADGGVEVVAEGARRDCDALVRQLRGPGTPGRVERLSVEVSDPTGDLVGFVTS